MLSLSFDPALITDTSTLIKIDVQVVFGAPNYKCNYSGICQIYALPDQLLESQACQCKSKAEAQLLFNPTENKVGLLFDASFVYSKAWANLFSDFYFHVDGDWVSSDPLNSRLRTPPFVIKEGIYPVLISEQGIKIWFRYQLA